MIQQLIVQSLYIGTEYYLFRPIGNNQYKEVPFKIVKNAIYEYPNAKLSQGEKNYILNTIL
ncbi:MAG: hypothetical protein KDD03_13315 [Gelidibacter sp.]|nr:hypothetical protein [Gelidibacter sp.]